MQIDRFATFIVWLMILVLPGCESASQRQSGQGQDRQHEPPAMPASEGADLAMILISSQSFDCNFCSQTIRNRLAKANSVLADGPILLVIVPPDSALSEEDYKIVSKQAAGFISQTEDPMPFCVLRRNRSPLQIGQEPQILLLKVQRQALLADLTR